MAHCCAMLACIKPATCLSEAQSIRKGTAAGFSSRAKKSHVPRPSSPEIRVPLPILHLRVDFHKVVVGILFSDRAR